jgi:hypothetical protein
MEETYPDLSKKEETYRSKIQSKIYYCLNCQAFDGGEAIWVQGDQISLEELFDKCRIPERYRNHILPHLYCSNCGTSHFDMWADVGMQTQYEKELSAHERNAKKLYGKHVVSLDEHLQKFPMLAFQNNFARRIFREIRDRKLPTTTAQGVYYRARKANNSKLLSPSQMLHAPLGRPTEGRFNHSGQSHLYLAREKTTALVEVSDGNSLVWCHKIYVPNEVEDILDLTFDWMDMSPLTSALLLCLNINNTIKRHDRNKQHWKPDYCITRFIMDCAKSCGYKGIKYESAKDSSENVVLFYPDEIKLKSRSKPSIIKLKKNTDTRARGKVRRRHDIFG